MVLVAACAGSEPLELDVRHGDGGGHSARHSPHAAAADVTALTPDVSGGPGVFLLHRYLPPVIPPPAPARSRVSATRS